MQLGAAGETPERDPSEPAASALPSILFDIGSPFIIDENIIYDPPEWQLSEASRQAIVGQRTIRREPAASALPLTC